MSTPTPIPVGEHPNDRDLWAIEMDGANQPIRAHRVVKVTGRVTRNQMSENEVRITGCDKKLNASTHVAWWFLPKGELPLADASMICCGLVP